MHKCPECGYRMPDKEEGFDVDPYMAADDEETRAKDDVLKELQSLMEGSLDSKLSGKKPSAMSVEIVASRPKKDEEEDEY